MDYRKTYVDLLKKARMRSTDERQRLFDYLCSLKQPVPLPRITTELPTLTPSTIYRNIDTFEAAGIVVAVAGQWKPRYELSDAFHPHHHHMTCRNCGEVIKFDEPPQLDQLLRDLARTHSFQPEHHSLELSGLCDNCC